MTTGQVAGSEESDVMRLAHVLPFSGRFPDFALPLWRCSSSDELIYSAVTDENRRITSFVSIKANSWESIATTKKELVCKRGDALPYAYALSCEDVAIGNKSEIVKTIRRNFNDIKKYTFSAVSAAKFADMDYLLPDLYLNAYKCHEEISPIGARIWRDTCVLLPVAREALLKKLGIPEEAVSLDGDPLQVDVVSTASQENVRAIICEAWRATNLLPEQFFVNVHKAAPKAKIAEPPPETVALLQKSNELRLSSKEKDIARKAAKGLSERFGAGLPQVVEGMLAPASLSLAGAAALIAVGGSAAVLGVAALIIPAAKLALELSSQRRRFDKETQLELKRSLQLRFELSSMRLTFHEVDEAEVDAVVDVIAKEIIKK